MNRDEISAVIVDLVRDVDGVAEPVSPSLSFDAMGVDSMSTMDVLMRVEKEFGVEIPDDRLAGMATIADLAAFVAAGQERAR